MDKPAIKGTNPKTDKEEERKPSVEAPFAGLIFKIATDPFVGKLAFFRVYSGALKAGSYVWNATSGRKERVSRIFEMHANKQTAIEEITAGNIGVLIGMKDMVTGTTICDEQHPIVLESIQFPEPVISIAVEPKTQDDIDKLANSLQKLAEEDPTFRVNTSEEHRGQEASRATWERPYKTCSSISSPSSRASVDDEQLDLGVITQGGSALPENHRDLVKQDLK